MLIVLIEANELGGHDNNFINGSLGFIPEGWAVVPADMVCENFPFGEVEVAEIDGVMTVTKWTPGVMPEPEPIPEPEEPKSVWDELDAAYQEGVDSV